MNYANLEFYSVVELEPATGGGLALRRFPKIKRNRQMEA